MPIQGSASDIMKRAMIDVYNKLKSCNLDAKLIMQVHDELIIDTNKSQVDKVLNLVCDTMKNAMKLSVPLEVDSSVGFRWSEGH
jgi:DNA polymerase-1